MKPLSRTHHYSRFPVPKRRKKFDWVGCIILLIFILLLINFGKFFWLIFVALPLIFYWVIRRSILLAFDLMKRASVEVEDFWTSLLGKDDNLKAQAHEDPYVETLEIPETVQRDPVLRSLWSQAAQYQVQGPLQGPSKNILRQIHALGDLFERFQSLLRTKLNPEELTFRRFMSQTSQGYELILNEIKEALSRMEQLQALQQTLGSAKEQHDATPLLSYQQMHQEQLQKINRLLSQTQDAVVQIARVNLSLVEMKGTSSRGNEDLAEAIRELEDLANRAKML